MWKREKVIDFKFFNSWLATVARSHTHKYNESTTKQQRIEENQFKYQISMLKTQFLLTVGWKIVEKKFMTPWTDVHFCAFVKEQNQQQKVSQTTSSVPSEIDVVFISKCIGIKKMSMKMKRKISCFHRHCWHDVRQKVGLSLHRLRFIHSHISIWNKQLHFH